MKIELLPARELSTDLVARWDQIARSSPTLGSPYFRPEFTQAVATVRDNVEVALLRDGQSVMGCFPFERTRGTIARPVGGNLSDYQGVIAAPEVEWDVAELMRCCRLRAWEFDHQLASQAQLKPYFCRTADSRCIDVAAGYEPYLAARKAAGAGALNEMLRKSRKLQREHQIRFQWHTTDTAVFDQLLAWKSDQYHRSGLTDLFAYPWIVSLLKDIWQQQTELFAGVLSVIYANDKIAAIHFGMRSGPLLHSWFPAYDIALGKYSPGAALLLFIVQHSAEHGVTRVDLGKGDEEYKLTLANAGVPLAEGVVETRLISAALRRHWGQARNWVRQSPLREPARVPIRWLRRMREWLALQ